jgi:hypothetical protein
LKVGDVSDLIIKNINVDTLRMLQPTYFLFQETSLLVMDTSDFGVQLDGEYLL